MKGIIMKWMKINEARMKQEDEFVFIDTGLKGDKAFNIIDGVIGQLSDGMWENSAQAEHYWRFAYCEKKGSKVVIKIKTAPWEQDGHRDYCDNWFRIKMNLNENAIKKFFAQRLKAVAKYELGENGGDWSRNNTDMSICFDCTFQEIYFVYETLLGRNCIGKFPKSVASSLMH